MSNYSKINVNTNERVELKEKLGLTGAEISVNTLPKGQSIPFIHSHKENEEIYVILGGIGYVLVDGEKVEVKKGDFIRISPAALRQFFAGTEDLIYLCIQVKVDSLSHWTGTDAVIEK